MKRKAKAKEGGEDTKARLVRVTLMRSPLDGICFPQQDDHQSNEPDSAVSLETD